MSRSSSVYSQQSEKRPTTLDYRNGSTNGSPSTTTNGSGRRTASFTPSFMSAHASKSSETLSRDRLPNPITIPQRPERSTTPQKPMRKPVGAGEAPPSPGVLLVLTAGALHPSTMFYLEMLLNRQHLSTIVFAGSTAQEAALKQLKMDAYGLIGKMGKETGVLTHTRETWSQAEIETVVQEAIKSGKATGLQGIICCPEIDEQGTTGADIFELETSQLESSWRQSVAFVHTALKATVPQLLSRCQSSSKAANGITSRTPQGPFFLVTGSTPYTAASQIAKSACDTLIMQLERSTKPKGLTVGYAEAMLVPEPVREKPKMPEQEPLEALPGSGMPPEEQIFTPSESPTKLWNMWALHEDIGHIED